MDNINVNFSGFHYGYLHTLLILSIRLVVSPQQWKANMDLLTTIALDKELDVSKLMDLYKVIPIVIDDKLDPGSIQMQDKNGNILAEVRNLTYDR